jgi:hypothetical protein
MAIEKLSFLTCVAQDQESRVVAYNYICSASLMLVQNPITITSTSTSTSSSRIKSRNSVSELSFGLFSSSLCSQWLGGLV